VLAADAPVQHAHVAALGGRDLAIVRILNRTRAAYGLPGLRISRRLDGAATAHSQDLAAHGLFSHSSSDGTSFADRIRRVTRAWLVGETLVEMTGRSTAQQIVQAWMNSPPHRQEILTRAFRRVGVGAARGGPWTIVTADFTS